MARFHFNAILCKFITNTFLLYRQEKAYRLKKKCVTRWTAVEDMLNSHLKAAQEIREVSSAFPDRVSDETVSNRFIRNVAKHTAYLDAIKA